MFVMALPWLLVLELVLYAGCFICGIIAAASLTINQGHFAGRCILYGSVHLNASDQSLVMESSSSPSLCYFVSAISVCVSIYCFSLILYWMYTSCVDKDANRDRSGLNMTLVLCGAVVFFLLVSGCVLRIGREHLCISILQTLPSLSSCEEAENKTWASPYFGNQFSSELHRAEVCHDATQLHQLITITQLHQLITTTQLHQLITITQLHQLITTTQLHQLITLTPVDHYKHNYTSGSL
ncbi:transmembrane protein 179B isoform X1 [Clupea harengus]|uniref:Transmembrane protein 179B isoform X1 n=1 Tax=Clupea harengus TaxID=7950 RepID=A0A8M1KPZ8_CLUHA|nr:transmembrane protein 179B isoform X1 [Clupea harengus]